MIAHAKANPGKLNFATLGGFADLMSEMIKKDAGIEMQIVPYRGAAEATVGVMRGDSHLTLNGYAGGAGPGRRRPAAHRWRSRACSATRRSRTCRRSRNPACPDSS